MPLQEALDELDKTHPEAQVKKHRESQNCPEIVVGSSLDVQSDMLLQEVLDDELDKMHPETYQRLKTSMELLQTVDDTKLTCDDDEDIFNSKVTNNYEKSVSPKMKNRIQEINRIRTMITGVMAKILEKNRENEDGKGTDPFKADKFGAAMSRPGTFLINKYKCEIGRLETEMKSIMNENSKLEEENAQLISRLASQDRISRLFKVTDAADEEIINENSKLKEENGQLIEVGFSGPYVASFQGQ